MSPAPPRPGPSAVAVAAGGGRPGRDPPSIREDFRTRHLAIPPSPPPCGTPSPANCACRRCPCGRPAPWTRPAPPTPSPPWAPCCWWPTAPAACGASIPPILTSPCCWTRRPLADQVRAGAVGGTWAWAAVVRRGPAAGRRRQSRRPVPGTAVPCAGTPRTWPWTGAGPTSAKAPPAWPYSTWPTRPAPVHLTDLPAVDYVRGLAVGGSAPAGRRRHGRRDLFPPAPGGTLTGPPTPSTPRASARTWPWPAAWSTPPTARPACR